MQKSGKCQTIFFRIFSKYKKLILDNLHLIWYINHVAEIQQDATIAQVVERIIGNDEVTGPTPVSSLFLCKSKNEKEATIPYFTRVCGFFFRIIRVPFRKISAPCVPLIFPYLWPCFFIIIS